MSIRTRNVRVHQVPEQLTANTMRSFVKSLKESSQNERPRLVLDCSMVWDMNRTTIELLLSCLEEVMKCNGDLRLAALRPEALVTLQQVGLSRLFEVFGTAESAIQSFKQRPASIAPLTYEGDSYSSDIAA